MTKILILALTFILASCGGGSGGSGSGPVIQPPSPGSFLQSYEAAMSSRTPGFVMQTNISGTEHRVSFTDMTNLFSVQKISSTSSIKETILKIDGDLTYFFIENTSNGFNHKSVSIRSKAQEMDLARALMDKGAVTIIGNSVYIKIEVDARPETYGNGSVQARKTGGIENYSIFMDAQNPLCTTTTDSTITGVYFSSPNLNTLLEDTSKIQVEFCPRPLTIAEVKAINLSSIQLCDETSNRPCLGNQNLSYLTQNL